MVIPTTITAKSQPYILQHLMMMHQSSKNYQHIIPFIAITIKLIENLYDSTQKITETKRTRFSVGKLDTIRNDLVVFVPQSCRNHVYFMYDY